MESSTWAELRKPFPPERVKTLEKRWTGRDGREKHLSLNYIDHPDVTDRLLAVDPVYETKVLSVFTDERMLEDGCSCGVHLALTIGGCTKEEYGNGKNLKEAMSDALKRAAMRYGVALDMWHSTPTSSPGRMGGNGGDSPPPPSSTPAPASPPDYDGTAESVRLWFGKFSGKTLGEVMQENKNYVTGYLAQKWEPRDERDRLLVNAAKVLAGQSFEPLPDTPAADPDDDIPFG